MTAQGAISFGIYKRIPLSHSVIDVTIGKWPEISISESRKIAQEKLYQIAKGVNPDEVKRAVKEDLTLGELYHSVREHEFSAIKTLKNYDSIYRCHLEKCSDKRLAEITPFAVQGLHARIGKETGNHAANRALQLLGSLSSKAKVRGFDKPNPAAGIRQFREKNRDRFVQPGEAKALFDAVLKEENASIRSAKASSGRPNRCWSRPEYRRRKAPQRFSRSSNPAAWIPGILVPGIPSTRRRWYKETMSENTSEKLTWDEILKRYDQQYVELVDFNWPDEEPNPLSGVVRTHNADKKEFYRLTKREPRPDDVAILWVGKLPREEGVIWSPSLVRVEMCEK